MKTWTLGLSFCLALLMAAGVARAVDVKGADQIKPEMGIQELALVMIPQEVNKEEFDAFVSELDLYETWGAANAEKWKSADTSDQPIKTIFSWDDLWSKSDIGAAGCLTVLMKLQLAKGMADSDPAAQVQQIEQAINMIEGMLAAQQLPPDQKAQMETQLNYMKSMLEALKKYPASNIEFYKANKEAIDAALARFDAIAGGDDQPAEEAPAEPQP